MCFLTPPATCTSLVDAWRLSPFCLQGLLPVVTVTSWPRSGFATCPWEGDTRMMSAVGWVMVSRTQAKVSDQGCSAASSGARWVSLGASGCWAVPLVVQGPTWLVPRARQLPQLTSGVCQHLFGLCWDVEAAVCTLHFSFPPALMLSFQMVHLSFLLQCLWIFPGHFWDLNIFWASSTLRDHLN